MPSPLVNIIFFFGSNVVADHSDHFAVLSHGLLQVLHHFHIHYLHRWCADNCAVVGQTCGPPLGQWSNAVFENQIVAVLLHRIDEELLYGNLLHSNTSL